MAERRFAQLESLLEKSTTYAQILKNSMDKAREKMESEVPRPSSLAERKSAKLKPKGKPRKSQGKKRALDDEADDDNDRPAAKKAKSDEIGVEKAAVEQPALITGTKLKGYQLEGLAWMASLWECGISGILGTLRDDLSDACST